MAQAVFTVEGLPEAPLDAAAHFHAEIAPRLRENLAEDIVLLFAPADHTHDGWRLAAVQELAREAAPARVNAVTGDDPDSIEKLVTYLAQAPGVTGQILQASAIPAETH
ncbi:Rossmann fold domain-containing protein [Alteraurantiacibacter aquimixticola]|uniref:Short chain dehydrogenase-like proteobacteria domain-containing protein n=1 Tax=Alteraurantiacibacter aquimixticola TaxID=2489173 RepID=A0A4V4U8M6_9SPHN|nr:hypothetical protein [Alteraurantiacibacter aquimixticola]TIX50563.1 hypothetical protein E5222_09865 [Alteraurantiacibacter aquimixticola]